MGEIVTLSKAFDQILTSKDLWTNKVTTIHMRRHDKCLCRTNQSETNRPWLFLLIHHKVEVWAFDLTAKQMTRVRFISNDKVKIEDISLGLLFPPNFKQRLSL